MRNKSLLITCGPEWWHLYGFNNSKLSYNMCHGCDLIWLLCAWKQTVTEDKQQRLSSFNIDWNHQDELAAAVSSSRSHLLVPFDLGLVLTCSEGMAVPAEGQQGWSWLADGWTSSANVLRCAPKAWTGSRRWCLQSEGLFCSLWGEDKLRSWSSQALLSLDPCPRLSHREWDAPGELPRCGP